MKKATMSVLTVWTLVSSMFIGLISFSEIKTVQAPYIPHFPIRINNNTEFALMAGIEGWAGNGLPGSPYIIEGYDINGSGYGYCIYIGNTTVYFKVRDSYLHEASGVGSDPYYFESGIILYNVQNGTVVNNTISSNDRRGIYLDYSSNNTIANNSAYSNKYANGIYLQYSNSNNIANNTAYSNYYEGIGLASSSKNTIANNTAYSNNMFGIALGSSSNKNTIVNNTISSNDHHGIYLCKSNNNTIANNTASSNNWEGIYLQDSDNNTIANNTVNSNNDNGIYLRDSDNNTIVNNSASSNNWDGICLKYTSSNTIANNNAYLNYHNGIGLASSSKNTIANNNAYSNNDNGIYLQDSGNNTIVNNNASSNNNHGIYLWLSSSNIITHNEMMNDGIYISGDMLEHWNTHIIDTTNTVNGKPVYYWKNQITGTIPLGAGQVILANSTNVIVKNQNVSDGSVGIELGFSNNNTIANNTASSNNWEGIYLYYSWNSNIITNNIVNSNNRSGILLRLSDSNIIANNIVNSNNDYGIRPYNSISNIIYHNNIIDNTNQAFDNTVNGNQWDNGYPSGGNFWSDYTGIDLNSTANQNVPPPDGIGDTPYIIDADSQDNYPLMQPYKPLENHIILKQGWNLISIPYIQDEENLTRVLGSINGWYDAVQWYDNSKTNDPWKHHKVGKPFGNDLTHLNETMGFWIHITNSGDTIFLYNGTQPTSNQSIPLHPGWNMVGYPSLTNRNRTAALNNLTFGTEVDAIWTFNAAIQIWEKIGAGDYFEVGRGYWIHAAQECVWEVPL